MDSVTRRSFISGDDQGGMMPPRINLLGTWFAWNHGVIIWRPNKFYAHFMSLPHVFQMRVYNSAEGETVFQRTFKKRRLRNIKNGE